MTTRKDPFISDPMSSVELEQLEHHLKETCDFPMNRATREAMEELVRGIADTLNLEDPEFDSEAFCYRVLNTTRIAGRTVPVEPGDVTTCRFSAGHHGKSEAGEWEFWTIYNDTSRFSARCRAGRDPGERFRRMERPEGYEKHWEVASTAKGIQPATLEEVNGWLDGHSDDAKHAVSCRVGSERWKVVMTEQGFRFAEQGDS